MVSIDVEEWFDRPILQPYIENKQRKTTVLNAVKEIIAVFKEYNKRTTFFILGELIEEKPELVEIIKDEGHEIGFHGYTHKILGELTKESFREDLQKGSKLIHKLTGEKPTGFRAPVFSLNSETSWALTELINDQYSYDSSVFPFRSPMYGASSAPKEIYYPDLTNPFKKSKTQRDLVEFPIFTQELLGSRIPYGGGFYYRILGNSLTLNAIRSANNKGMPAMLYFHPWELCGFPEVDMPPHKKLFSYHNSSCLKNLKHLIKNVKIKPAREIIEKWT